MIDQKWTNIRKSRYNSKYVKVDTIAIWKTANKEECSKQLILESRFKIADLIQNSEHKTGLIVRLIANKYYKDTFYFLSFLLTVLKFLSLALHFYSISLYWIIYEII